MKTEVELQRDYYTRTASQYDGMHVHGDGEHDLACALIRSLSEYHKYQSILDVGSGTGRALARLSGNLRDCRVIGIEPVESLRKIGHSKGIPEQQLIEGDATKLAFPDSSFDLVVELGVLHHIPKPRLAVAEMLRVAKKLFLYPTQIALGKVRFQVGSPSYHFGNSGCGLSPIGLKQRVKGSIIVKEMAWLIHTLFSMIMSSFPQNVMKLWFSIWTVPEKKL